MLLFLSWEHNFFFSRGSRMQRWLRQKRNANVGLSKSQTNIYPLSSLFAFLTGQPGVCCGEDGRADGCQRAETQCWWCGRYSVSSGAHEVCVQGEVKKRRRLHNHFKTLHFFLFLSPHMLGSVMVWFCIFYHLPPRIAVFSVSVLHDERIVVVAEQRPDASEEDSFQWMSRVLQVLLVLLFLHQFTYFCLLCWNAEHQHIFDLLQWSHLHIDPPHNDIIGESFPAIKYLVLKSEAQHFNILYLLKGNAGPLVCIDFRFTLHYPFWLLIKYKA